MSNREVDILAAKIDLAEVRKRREHQRAFCFVLLDWAANARKRAAAATIQKELFA